MRRLQLSMMILLACGLLATGWVPAGAQGPAASTPPGRTSIFQLALWYPVQIYPAETAIHGLRINLLYGDNREVQGVDFGLVNRVGRMVGYQTGLVGWVEGDFTGLQDNLVNIVSGKLTGVQTAFYNDSQSAEGVLWGFVNVTDSMNGLQLGLINYTRNLHGLQIGLLNVAQAKENWPVLPIVNWSF